MSNLPISGRYNSYRGGKREKQLENHRKSQVVDRIVDCANRMVANDSAEVQKLLFSQIARKVGCDVAAVRDAIYGGGGNGITVRVTEENRIALDPYKSIR